MLGELQLLSTQGIGKIQKLIVVTLVVDNN